MPINKLSNNFDYKYLIHAAAPYIAVVIGLYCFRNAWIALLLYHSQIILYACLFKTGIKNLLFEGFFAKHFLMFVLPLLFLGPFLYLVFPYVLNDGVSLQEWLYAYGLSNKDFITLIPYFCIIHPILEEVHWGKFREYKNQQWIMCSFFAGYHTLVLASLLSYFWLSISFLALVVAAYIWTRIYNKLRGGIIPFLSHLVADIGIIAATYVFAFK